MSDEGAFACFGICCICCTASLQSWCLMNRWGAEGCCNSNSQSGCCGSCFGDSFNEDSFDQAVKKDLEKTRAANTDAAAPPSIPEPVNALTMQQPTPGRAMAISTETR